MKNKLFLCFFALFFTASIIYASDGEFLAQVAGKNKTPVIMHVLTFSSDGKRVEVYTSSGQFVTRGTFSYSTDAGNGTYDLDNGQIGKVTASYNVVTSFTLVGDSQSTTTASAPAPAPSQPQYQEQDSGGGDSNGASYINAAGRGDIEAVKRLLGMGVDVNYSRGEALGKAAENGHLEMVQFLINNFADPDRISGSYPAIVRAAYAGHIEICKFLISKGANKNNQEVIYLSGTDVVWRGHSPLSIAASLDNFELAKLLVESGARIDVRNTSNGYTPLFYAIYYNNTEMVKYLLQSGANVNHGGLDVKYNIIPSALHIAAANGNLEIVKILVEAGADLSKKNNRNATPLKIASQNKRKDVVAYLKYAEKEAKSKK